MAALSFSDNQVIAAETLACNARFICLFGGARSGKTFLIIRAIIMRALKAPGSRHLIARFRQNAVWTSIAGDANSTLFAVAERCFDGLSLGQHRQDGYFDLPNGSTIWLGGLDDKERVDKILGREYSTVYLNEASEIPYSSVLIALTRLAEVRAEIRQRAYIDLNPIGKGHWTNRMFNEHCDPISRLPYSDHGIYASARLNPQDNIHNLDPAFITYLNSLPEKQRKRFLEGEYVDEVEGALWSYEMIDKCRVAGDSELPDMQRVVIGVDPSGASGPEDERSDEIGIVAAGLGTDGRGYILADYSGRFSPEAWASRVLYAWQTHKADLVIAEKNFGGAMVESIIQSQANARGILGVKIELTVASRGKAVRAEPISALYAADKVRHVGRFPDMEEQLLMFSAAGYLGERSPDRADAMIWALSNLLVEDQDFSGMWARFGAALN